MQNAILVKTDRGQQAVKDRDSCPELTGRLRTLLLQVDGQKTGAALIALAGSIGAPADGIERLLELGLIMAPALVAQPKLAPAPVQVPEAKAPPTTPAEPEPAPPILDEDIIEEITVSLPPLSDEAIARMQTAKRLMRAAASEYLGLKAMFFTKKVEQCTHPEALRPLLEQLRQGIAKAKNPVRADLVVHDIVVLLEHNI